MTFNEDVNAIRGFLAKLVDMEDKEVMLVVLVCLALRCSEALAERASGQRPQGRRCEIRVHHGVRDA